jgi:uncharacterized protein
MRPRLWLGAALLTAFCATTSLSARGAEAPVRVLFVLLGSGPHDITKTAPLLQEAMKKDGGFAVTMLEPPAGQPTNAEHLAKLADLKPGDYDAVVFYTGGGMLSSEQEMALTRYVESGGGLVAIHSAAGSFRNSEVWKRLVGGRFAGHAPGTFSLNMIVSDPTHPAVKGLKEFTVTDEEYTHDFAPGVERHVIVKFKERPANTVEKNGNMDAVWTQQPGKGRIFYTCLGHDVNAWSNPAWQKLTLQGILWSAGKPREVKIQ